MWESPLAKRKKGISLGVEEPKPEDGKMRELKNTNGKIREMDNKNAIRVFQFFAAFLLMENTGELHCFLSYHWC